jgi:hypothetical protein
MEPLLKIGEEDEAELRVLTANMYKNGGVYDVLACVSTMQKVIIIIMKKLNELLDEEHT